MKPIWQTRAPAAPRSRGYSPPTAAKLDAEACKALLAEDRRRRRKAPEPKAEGPPGDRKRRGRKMTGRHDGPLTRPSEPVPGPEKVKGGSSR